MWGLVADVARHVQSYRAFGEYREAAYRKVTVVALIPETDVDLRQQLSTLGFESTNEKVTDKGKRYRFWSLDTAATRDLVFRNVGRRLARAVLDRVVPAGDFTLAEANPPADNSPPLALVPFSESTWQRAFELNLGGGEEVADYLGTLSYKENLLKSISRMHSVGSVLLFARLEDPSIPDPNKRKLIGVADLDDITNRYLFHVSRFGISADSQGKRYGKRVLKMALDLFRTLRRWDMDNETLQEFLDLVMKQPAIIAKRTPVPTMPSWAQLQVHRQNAAGIGLYESLGFFSARKSFNKPSTAFIAGDLSVIKQELYTESQKFTVMIKDLEQPDQRLTPPGPTVVRQDA
jgi:ribosomal protein S18 acetylase RimI-like enzyme